MRVRTIAAAAIATLTIAGAGASSALANAPFSQVNGNGSFSAHCDDYTSWRLETSSEGLPKPRLTATCSDENGATVYLKAKFVDRAEPGAHKDIARVWWSYTDPNASHAPFIKDVGAIQDGNLQYHPGA
jgi:hypothetical protein